MTNPNEAEAQIARIRQRLAALDAERLTLQRELEALEQSPLADGHEVVRRTDFGDAPVTNASSSAEKIALFRDLFADREVVFSPRWETTAGCPVRLFGGERVSREIDKELHTWCHIV